MSSGEPMKNERQSGKYLVLSFWKRLCRPHRRPPHSGTLRQCRHTPGTASWEWHWACTRTWLASHPPCCRSTPRSGVSRRHHPRACLGWTLVGSPGCANAHRCRWRSRRWRQSCHWDCGGCRCRLVRRRDWRARFWRKNHSLRIGVGPQRAFWVATWIETHRAGAAVRFGTKFTVNTVQTREELNHCDIIRWYKLVIKQKQIKL